MSAVQGTLTAFALNTLMTIGGFDHITAEFALNGVSYDSFRFEPPSFDSTQ